jgi:acyl-CoA reductase-like NAD-dependent aldehyde dehydrogenase
MSHIDVTYGDLERAAADVSAASERWAALALGDRIRLLDRVLSDCAAVAPEWQDSSARGKGVENDPDASGQEWVSGPYVTLRYLHGVKRTLEQIRDCGEVRYPAIFRRPRDGRTIVRALPQDGYDRLFFTGLSVEVVMRSGIAPADIPSHTGGMYLGERAPAGTTLVLSAGNVSGMGPVDALHALLQGNHTVLLKMNPVNGYMREILERGLGALIEEGFLRIVEAGPTEASFLCDLPTVDAIHLTGSNRTYEALVYGTGDEPSGNKSAGAPIRTKPVTAELGGVGPVVVVPGRWTERELRQGAELVATIAFDGAGFSCGAIDLIVLSGSWPQREYFLMALRTVLEGMTTRPARYPGAVDRYRSFVDSHPRVELFGETDADRLAWALIRDLDPEDREEMCFLQEPFCAVCAEVTLRSDGDLGRYLIAAARFLNERVRGTLGATLLVPRSVSRDPEGHRLIEEVIAGLRYGAIGVNYHPSASWVSGTTPWGGFQADDIDPAESGVGFTQNAMMLSHTEKSVLRAPLWGPLPAPVWLYGHGRAMCTTFSRLCAFEADPSVRKVPGIVRAGIS